METLRKPFQGVYNIIRFNWHFYANTLLGVLFLYLLGVLLPEIFSIFLFTLSILIMGTMVLSLIASYYIYDLSGLYELNWIERNNDEAVILNINAGFDETSQVLQGKFKNSKLLVFDFYDHEQHTEISIERARKAYPAYPNTQKIKTNNFQLPDQVADKVFVIFAAHEIRDESERILFFNEINRILKPNGQIYVTEHLRDLPNFIVYNFGFLHFYTKKSWFRVFEHANLRLKQKINHTLFISSFILHKNGNTL